MDTVNDPQLYGATVRFPPEMADADFIDRAMAILNRKLTELVSLDGSQMIGSIIWTTSELVWLEDPAVPDRGDYMEVEAARRLGHTEPVAIIELCAEVMATPDAPLS